MWELTSSWPFTGHANIQSLPYYCPSRAYWIFILRFPTNFLWLSKVVTLLNSHASFSLMGWVTMLICLLPRFSSFFLITLAFHNLTLALLLRLCQGFFILLNYGFQNLSSLTYLTGSLTTLKALHLRHLSMSRPYSQYIMTNYYHSLHSTFPLSWPIAVAS